MRVFHVIRSLDPDMGGPPAVVIRLAAAQAPLGAKVSIVCYSSPGKEHDIATSMEGIPGIDAVKIQIICDENRFERFFAQQAKHMFARMFKPGDMVHLHGVWDPVLLAAANIARQRGVYYAVTPHGMLDPWCLSQKRWKKKLALWAGLRNMLNKSGFLHLLNENEQQLIEQLRLTCDVEVIPNGIFVEEIEPLPCSGSFIKNHSELHGRSYILFLSRLHYKKGLDVLARAFGVVAKRYLNVDLVVAGADDGARDAFCNEISMLGLEGRVHLIGPVYGAEKLAALVDSTVFCLPSRQEGFSVAILEALGCGIPVVISQECHFPEVAQSRAGLITELDPDELGAALMRYLENEEFRELASKAARQLVLKHFTWPKIAGEMMESYVRVIRNNYQ